MAHIRKPLGFALALNTVICVAEAVAGARANSISLLMDAVHNLSDELALVCLFLAYLVRARISRGLQRSANILNSVGLLAVSVVILWQALERLANPVPIGGSLATTIALAAALGNWGVARVLRPWQTHSAAIRLAYIHNLGDTYVSLLPALAGILVVASGLSAIDAALAAILAAWISYSTIQEIRQSSDALLFPENAECPHAAHAAV